MGCTRGENFLHLWWTFPLFFLTLLFNSSALNSDGTLLLSFKYSVLSDPLLVLDNWNYDDSTPCSWTGVTCAAGPPDTATVVSLVLPNSQLLGSIPEDLGMIQTLRTLDLSANFLNGTLPSSLFNSSELQVLSLANNLISGELPEFTDGVKGLQVLNLSDNALAGNIPETLSSLPNLIVVSLGSNYFSGSIPSGFQFVQFLDLSSNSLNGSLPIEFGGQKLRHLNLSYNKLSGPVSPGFGKLIPGNATIDLSFNNLTGEIPQIVGLSNQKTESFVGNADLCGKPLKNLCAIPSTLSNPPNVTTNNSAPAIAAIPKSIDSVPVTNSSGTTSSGSTKSRGLKPVTIAGIVVGDFAGIGLLAIVLLYVYQLKKKKKQLRSAILDKSSTENEYTGSKEEPDLSKGGVSTWHGGTKQNLNSTHDRRSVSVSTTWSCLSAANGNETNGSDSDEKGNRNDSTENEEEKYRKEKPVLVMVDGETELEMESLLKASAYILGSSGPSIVYKAVLEDGTAFAVRRIGDSGVERLKEFENQVRAVGKLRHPNLVRVRGFYWGHDEKLVIYDYVSSGSLATAGGYKRIGSSPCHLPFEVRLRIARGVARGLAYIHEKKNVHGNIKPSNILLTDNMEPVISDFGLEWLVSGRHSYKTDGSTRHYGSKRSTPSRDGMNDHSNCASPYVAPMGFMGCTSPYHAPESLKTLKPNPKWDVYSFGIVLLELLTGKVFCERELSQWTTGSVVEDKTRLLQMADVTIRADVEGREDATLACFKLGFSCASLLPQKRPCMKDAVQVLEKIPSSSSLQ